uniref:Protein transport protein SEC24-like CEF n=1 Tax=Tanacetum cinerariifolium TaxID=118510 RepID=A0A699KQ46_TANCI|nr:protein transport protein SEC24-like CEF [Tanacetum cinerariifolium]
MDEVEIKRIWEEYFSFHSNMKDLEGHEEVMDPNILPHFDYYYSRISLTKKPKSQRWLTSLFNKIFTSAKMPEEWRLSDVIPIFKNKGDAPSMLYGSECWLITKALANRMKVAKLIMLSWACGKTMLDMINSEVYRAKLQVETIINKMREGRLRWFGHVRRRAQSAPLRRVEALVIDGLRRRGRPKLRLEKWREVLEDNGLRVSQEKIKYLRCDFGNGEIAYNKEVEICIGDKILQPKESFRYLGSMLHKSRRIDEEVAYRIKTA